MAKRPTRTQLAQYITATARFYRMANLNASRKIPHDKIVRQQGYLKQLV